MYAGSIFRSTEQGAHADPLLKLAPAIEDVEGVAHNLRAQSNIRPRDSEVCPLRDGDAVVLRQVHRNYLGWRDGCGRDVQWR